MVNENVVSHAGNEAKLKRRSLLTKILGQTWIWIFLILMYVPILVLIASSFVASEVIGQWTGFSMNLFFGGEVGEKYYVGLFRDSEIGIALANTIILALSSSLIATLLGTIGAIGAFYSKKRWRSVVENTTQIPVVNAEIVIALSLTVLFVFAGNYLFAGTNIFSFWTLLIGHVVLALPFVYLSVKPKLQQMDPALYEAALDLGCSNRQALMKATVPEILPGVASGFLLSITLSLDDFIVTAFTRGAGLLSGDKTIETLSTLVQAKIKKGPIPPGMRALTTMIFLFVLLVVILITVYRNLADKRGKRRRGREY